MSDVAPTPPAAADSAAPTALPCSFCEFLVSLGQSAMLHLGQVPDPVHGKANPNPTMARHTIDVLKLLSVKTQGNLDEDESRLLDALIKELDNKYEALSAN